MNVSAWSIRHPTPAVMLFFLLMLAGVYSFAKMIIQTFPDIELPIVTVTTTFPGATPGQLETDVARKIENALVSVQGVKHQYTNVRDGLVINSIEFRLESRSRKQLMMYVRQSAECVASFHPGSMNQ